MSLHQEPPYAKVTEGKPSAKRKEAKPRRGRHIQWTAGGLALLIVGIAVACSTGPGGGTANAPPERTGTTAAAYTTTAPGGIVSGNSYWIDGTGGCIGSSAAQVASCAGQCSFPPYCAFTGSVPPPNSVCPQAPFAEMDLQGAPPCYPDQCFTLYFQPVGPSCPGGFFKCGVCQTSPPPKSQAPAQKAGLDKLLHSDQCGTGMCVPNANLMLATLNLNDTPVGYAPQKGPGVFVRLTYNHMEAALPATIPFFNVGPNWTQSFLSYITDDPAHVGLSVTRNAMGGGQVDESTEAGAYNTSTGAFPPELQGAAVLQRNPASGTLSNYTLTLPDGSVQTFGVVDGASAFPRRVFLSSIADPQGNTLTLNYNTTTADGGVPTCPTSAPGCRLQTITDAESRTTTFCYTANADAGNCWSGTDDKIYSITDPFGRQAVLTYDANTPPRLSSIKDVLGITSSFTYDSGSGSDPTFITQLTTPYGNSTFAGATNYDANTRWLTITDANSNTERVEFDGTLPSGVDAGAAPSVPSGLTFTASTLTSNNTFVWDKHVYATDGAGSLSYADAKQYHWLLNRVGNTSPVLGAVKAARENFVFYNYPGQSTTGDYGKVGTLDKPIAVGRILDDGTTSQVWNIAYGLTNPATGFPTMVTDPLGKSLKFTYASNNIDLTEVDRETASGPTWTPIAAFTYNTSTAPLHVPLTAIDAAGQTTNYTYTTAGQVATVSDPLSHVTTVNHDGTGRVTTIVDANSTTALTNTYPSTCSSSGLINCDLPTSVTDSEGRAVSYTRDNLDRVTTVTYPDATTDLYDWTFQSGTYSGTPSLEVRKYTDRLGRAVTYNFDAARQLTSMVEPTSGSSTRTTSYAWYENGARKSLTDPNGNETLWAVDIESRPTSKTLAYGTGSAATESYGYETTTSRLKTITDPLSEVKTYAYDKADELTGITYTSTVNTTSNVTFAYDTWFPRRTSMTDGIGTTTWSYVAVGTNGALQLLTEDGPFSGTLDSVTYTYDADGRESARTISGGNESLSYDAIGRVSTHGTTLGSFSYGYNGETDAPTSRSVTNSSVTVSTAWNYDNNTNDRRLLGITNKIGSTTVRGYTYSWGTTNDAGVSSNPYDITGIAETAGAGGTWSAQSWSYSYDKRDRLTGATTGSPTSWNFAFTRDNTDNITALTRSTGGSGWSSYTPNALNQRTGTGAPTYDANGNITNDVSQYQQKFDAENRMVEADFQSSGTLTGQKTKFQYDGIGRRLVETEIATNGTTSYILRFLWCGDEICQTRSWNGSTETVGSRSYAEGEDNIGVGKYANMPDQLGSVRDFVDVIGGTVVMSLDYGPEGETVRWSGSTWPSHRYAGMINRGPYNGHLTRYRIQNPTLITWDSRDPIREAGGLNLHGYVGGMPTMAVDPLGLQGRRNGIAGPGATEIEDAIAAALARLGEQGAEQEAVAGEVAPLVLPPIASPSASCPVRPDGVPPDWNAAPSDKGDGTKYVNPENPNYDYVRDMPGNPNSSNPAQQNPYVVRMKNGMAIDQNGNQVPPKSPEAHVPRGNFKFYK